jgi:2-C-methyl-D-erythritol 4-phosphate cytidylyltransferase
MFLRVVNRPSFVFLRGCSFVPFVEKLFWCAITEPLPLMQFEVNSTLTVYLSPAMKVVVIIPAAGLGTRMSPAGTGKVRVPSKQFTELGGTPILVHTLRKFAASPKVTEIVVALRKDEIPGFRERLQSEASDVLKKKVELVEGGEHRQHSVANALQSISASPNDVVLVHDAVRPFVTGEIIEEVIRGAEKFGAAIAGMPAVDTVKKVERTADGALITATIPREYVVMAQTPQGFRYEVLKQAFDEAAADEFVGTDEASLVERSGHEVAVVMGSPQNIKITNPGDMELAEFYLRHQKSA